MREAKPRRVGGRWQVRLTDEHGKRRKQLFNAHADALKALVAKQAMLAEVKDGLRDPTPADHSVDQAFDYWEKVRVPQRRSGADDVSILERHLRPFFGSMKLKDIGRAETDLYQVEKQHLDPKTLSNDAPPDSGRFQTSRDFTSDASDPSRARACSLAGRTTRNSPCGAR